MAWVRAGTITVAANSATVTGTNTGWLTAGIRAGDAMYINGAAYEIKSVDSATQISLQTNVPTAVTNGTYQIMQNLAGGDRVAITTELANLLATRLREYQVMGDIANTIFGSDASSVSIVLPNGQSRSGAGWGYLTSGLADKLSKNQNLNDLTNKAAARTNLGLGNSAGYNIGSTVNTVAVGDDPRFGTLDGKTGGLVSSGTTFTGAIQAKKTVPSEISQSSEMLFSTIFTGNSERARIGLDVGTSAAGERVGRLYVGQDNVNKVWTFVYGTGSANAPGQWVNGSDRRFKTNIVPIENPLEKMRAITGCTWDRLDFKAKGIGFIAQDVQKVFPNSVYDNFAPVTLMDGTVLENTYSLDTSGVAAALHHQAILALMDNIDELQNRMKSIDGLDA